MVVLFSAIESIHNYFNDIQSKITENTITIKEKKSQQVSRGEAPKDIFFALGHLLVITKELLQFSRLPRWLSDKESACQCRRHQRHRFDPGWEDPLEEEMATCFGILAGENPTDRGAWRATIHGITKSRTQLSTHIRILQSPHLFFLQEVRS